MNRTPRPLLILGLILVSLTLRPVIAGFGPLLPDIQKDLRASAATTGLLTTIPLVCWGIFGLLAPRLTRRAGAETVILVCAALIGVGAWLRAGATLTMILPGTLLVGVGIAVINVLLPSLLRRDFPRHFGLMTGLYTLAVVGGAALASALAVPLQQRLGGSWRASLAVWVWPSLAAVVAWLPAVLGQPPRTVREEEQTPPGIWSNPATLPVTVYMGAQSLFFFTWLTWLAPLLQDRGQSSVEAGGLLFLANLVQLPFTLGVPLLAARLSHLRPLLLLIAAVMALGVLGLLLPVTPPLPWVLLLGIGAGSAFPLALHFIAHRARTPQEVARLSGVAQGAGYLIAAAGPLAFGALRDLSGGWTWPLGLLLVCAGVMLWAGLRAAES